MSNRFQAFVDFLPGNLSPTQHYRNLALIGVALLIVIGIIAGWSVVFSILCALLGGFAAVLAYDWLTSQPSGSGRLRQSSERIRAGAQLFLLNVYKSIAWLSLFVAILIGLTINWGTATGFLIGVLLSELVGYLGFNLTLRTRSITLNATTQNLLTATQLALSSGVISGLLVAGTALFGLVFYYTLLLASESDNMFSVLSGLASGAVSVALLVSVSAAIFAQSSIASCRNKAFQNSHDRLSSQPDNMVQTIAEHIADCTGVITDLFATVVAALVATIIINRQYASIDQLVTYPMVIMAVAIVSVIVVLQVLQRLNTETQPALLLQRLLIASALLNAILLLPTTWWMFDQSQLSGQTGLSIMSLYQSVIIGLFLTLALSAVAGYQIRATHSASNNSFVCKYAVAVMYGMILIGSYSAYRVAGLIGLETSIISLLSLSAMMVAVATFGRLIDPDQSETSVTDQITQQQQLGSIAKAVSQTYTLAASTLVALVLGAASVTLLAADTPFSLINIQLLMGIIIGVVIALWFCALLIQSISRVTNSSQSISSSHYAISALVKRCKRELLIPVLVPFTVAILIAYLFSDKLVNGLAIGVGLGGLLIGLAAITGGDVWVFMKRYLEYFWSAANKPMGWDDETAEQSMTNLYRNAITATLSPLIKMIAIIALLMTV
jgi:K(+)-stimulated pyrophosphate-energized sodium pump